MPAKSPQQLKLIWAIRNKYKSKRKSPKKWKWVWGEEWGHLAKESNILNFNQFSKLEHIDNFTDSISQEDLELVEDILLELSEKWGLSHETHENSNGYVSIKGINMEGKGGIVDIGIQLNPKRLVVLNYFEMGEFEKDINNIISKFERFGFSLVTHKHRLYLNKSQFDGYISYKILLSPPNKLNEANQNLKSRAHLDECWYNAKLGDIVSEEYIYNYVQYLHDDYDGGFVDGDLGDRIEEYGRYKLMEIPISEIELDDFQVDDWAIVEYKNKIKETGDYPPIVLDDKQHGKYGIIDGNHRGLALSELQKTIKAWVGIWT
jgi:ParB-like nuclease domain